MSTRMIIYIASIPLALFSSVALIFFFIPIQDTSRATVAFVTTLLTFIHIHLLFLMKDEWRRLLKRQRIAIIVFTLLFSFLALLSMKGEQDFLLAYSFKTRAYVYIGTFFFLSSLVLWIIFSSLKIEVKPADHLASSKWSLFKYAVPSIILWGGYALAIFPAAMTFDSVDQWHQAHTGHFSNWHPLMYTLFIMGLTKIWDSPAIVALSQIIIISLIFGYCMAQFEKAGIRRFWLWIVSILFAINPINGIYSITIWKDILYSAFILLFSTTIFHLVITNGKWLNSKKSTWIFFLAAFGVVFFRHNGFPVFLVMLIVLLMVFRRQWKPLILSGGSIIAFYLIFTGPVFHYLKVAPSDPNEVLSIPTQQIARVIEQGGKLTEEQAQYLNQILPLPLWKQYYHPYITNRIKFSKEYNRSAIFPDHLSTYMRTWLEICAQNPKIAKEAFLKQTSLVWQMNEPQDGHTYTFVTNVWPHNRDGLKSQVIVKPLTEFITQYLKTSDTDLKPFIWRPANYMFLIVLFTFITALRNDWKAWLVPFALFLNIGSIFIALPAQDFRYLYANTLVFYLSVLFMFIRYKDKEPSKQSS
ncbi:DUF6020 family protein [Anoxybacteroides rupiense]|uniref:DUF6020 family protein n=1 Tax=Anoxybacteroides rupiense TaxID=311460 RepID=A0ABD5IR29_9BACL|nr:DUF6020 family protein [Anoxybacillus rupiensis]MBB3907743.1 hypothetical protein [Anoxybacillus rupiensis]MED5050745.1 DUF6020 family protein [Anoxybacillus rupiensis]